MKANLKKGLFLTIGLCLSMTPSTTNAQVAASVTGVSHTALTEVGIQNVGVYTKDAKVNSMIPGNMTVHTWDGVSPGIGWYHDLSGLSGTLALPLTATDPDIALNDNGLEGLVVYEDGGNIMGRRIDFGGTAFSFPGPAFQISSGLPATHPNIDGAGKHQNMVIVWTELDGGFNQMRSSVYDYSTTTLQPAVSLSTNFAGNDMYTPDVAIYDKEVYYSYIVDDTGTHLFSQKEDIFDVYNNITLSLNNNINFIQSSVVGGAIANPRIATKAYMGGSVDPYAVVAEFTMPTNQQHIISYTQSAGVNSVNLQGKVYKCTNNTPVISWNNCQEYVVAWNHGNTTADCPTNLSGADILARKLDANGFPISNTYQWVNAHITGPQNTVGLSGRYALSSITTVGYADQNVDQFIYKQVACSGSPYMREAEPVVSDIELHFNVYPNPASKNLFVEAENINEITIYSMSGQIVKHIETDRINQKEIDISDLDSGLYILQLNSDQGIEKQKISIQ